MLRKERTQSCDMSGRDWVHVHRANNGYASLCCGSLYESDVQDENHELMEIGDNLFNRNNGQLIKLLIS